MILRYLFLRYSVQGTVSMAEQSVVSVADSQSNFEDHVSGSRGSSEEPGDIHSGNKDPPSENGDTQMAQRSHVEQVRIVCGSFSWVNQSLTFC